MAQLTLLLVFRSKKSALAILLLSTFAITFAPDTKDEPTTPTEQLIISYANCSPPPKKHRQSAPINLAKPRCLSFDSDSDDNDEEETNKSLGAVLAITTTITAWLTEVIKCQPKALDFDKDK